MAQLFDPQALSQILPIWGSLHSFGQDDGDGTDDEDRQNAAIMAGGSGDNMVDSGTATVAPPASTVTPASAGPSGATAPTATPAIPSSSGKNFQLNAPNFDQLPSSPRAEALKGQLDAVQSAHPSTGSLLIKAITTLAPILAARGAGLFQGAGAAQGASESLINQQQLDTERRKELIQEVEGEQGRQEREYEAGIHGQVAQAQVQSLGAYRDLQATLKDQAQKNQQQHYKDMYDQQLRKNGQRLNVDTGEVENIPREELPASQGAMIDLRDAQEQLATARANAVPEQIEIAKQKVKQSLAMLNVSLQGLELRKENAAATNYGTDTAGHPLPGSKIGDDGQPVGSRFQANTGPTTEMRNKAGQGRAISTSGKALIDQLQNPDGTPTALAGKLGPIMGRISNLDQLLEIQDPDIAKYGASLASYAALQPALHQFRGAAALHHFTDTIGGLPRSPANIIAAIQGIEQGAVQPQIEQGTPKLAKGPGTSTQLTKGKAQITHRWNPVTKHIEAIGGTK